MQDLIRRLDTLEADFLKLYEKLEITQKLNTIKSLEKEVADPDIWKNVETATAKNQELSALQDETAPYELLKTQITDLKELINFADEDLKPELDGQLTAMESTLKDLKKALRYSGPYDNSDAILRITSGAGGTEAMDWAGMLERMYLRFFEKKGLKPTNLERTTGEEAGIKTAVYEI
ncbi:PCRF domain-containing protein, partial [Candidatus Saccharibacteria bacterium]|nr:PCRF domain-containing protein [Candidatus Saccharibacteria bacterium]